jgi:N12 class adenine-specific DNA methylase
LSAGERATLRRWTSLAQWVGTERGIASIDRVEEVWPGYGDVAARSVLNAYYTDPEVIGTVWSWLESQGVTEGVGFEPGCGRGDWMTLAPAGVVFDAVDIDPISVRIARALTGQNVVDARIEEWHLGRGDTLDATQRQGGYDVVVGNVPFSSHRPGRNNPHGDSLHNLAIARSVSMLRPGGIATVLTSRFSLDAGDPAWRRRVADQVDLVAAFRLPSRTHREAGTDVVTDLLVLRRPLSGEDRPTPDWLDTTTLTLDADTTTRVNTYWTRHRDHVLGRVEPGGAYRRENFTVVADRPAHEALAERLAPLRVDFAPVGDAPSARAPAPIAVSTETGRALPAGSIVLDPTSGTGFSRDGREHPCAKKHRHQLRMLVTMRGRALGYLERPSDEARTELADLYGAYRELYPPLNSFTLVEVKTAGRDTDAADADRIDDDRVDTEDESSKFQRRYPRLEGFRTDPSWWNVAALEDFDDDTGTAAPAALLQRPVIALDTDTWPTSAATIEQAVANSSSRWHRIDVGYIASQLAANRDDAIGQLGAVAFETPAGEWELAAYYLAGDVVGKLDTALEASRTEPRFVRNVDALRSVQPTPLTAAEITPEFGATWLTADEIAAFVSDNGGGQVAVKYHPPSGTWSYDGWGPQGPSQFRTTKYGMAEQVVRACNATPVTAYKTIQVGDSEQRVIDVEATAAEQLCRDNLSEALQTWCWSDPDRAATLAGRYNHMFNRYRAEHWDGAHLTLPGLAADFTPRPHQKDVVWRILASADAGVLMAHGVGAGKTAAMIIAAHETRRTGRVDGTTLFAVPGNMVEQFARDYLRLYPAARVLTPHGKTQRDAVREFAARVATGDFDAAICSHSHLKAVPLSPQVEREVLERRLADFADYNPAETLSRAAAKRWAKTLERQTARLESLRDAVEDPAATYFDRMGVGMLILDEAHLAKNIALQTNHQGLPMPAGSQLAEAVLARTDWIRSAHGDAAVVMATATPVTNSPAEMWVAARLCAPRPLATAGLEHFDAFAANFLAPVETVEHTAGGKLKVVTRLGEYKNFPDLARLFRSFTDVRPTASLGFKLPELVGGEATVHVAEPTDQQLTAAAWAAERADGQHIDLEPGVTDPAIAILSTSRSAALHPATISGETCARWATRSFPRLRFDWDEPNNKLIAVADTIAEINHRTGEWTYPDSERPGAAQVVFCDAGVPRGDGNPSVYSELTDLLVDRGVRRADIAWVHDVADPSARQPLWDQVRSGHVRVLIGSTMQMGVGVNIQPRLYAAHELTAPYRPDWLEQAEGRMIRQGNHHDQVELHRYVTERTADARSWQILQRKAHFIGQAMSDPEQMTRSLRDESVVTPAEEFAQISAIATGDQRHIELAALTATVTRLERAERAHHASRSSQQQQITRGQDVITRLHTQITTIEALTPEEVEPTVIGQQVLAMRYDQCAQFNWGGIMWEAHRDGEVRLTIPDTGIRIIIDRDRLYERSDDGRGIGTSVLRVHQDLDRHLADRRTELERAVRQLDAERERPVPAEFPRHGELVEARFELDRLQVELMPQPDTGPAPISTGADPGDDPQPFAESTAGVAHPVFGHRDPSTAERFAWSAAYDRYSVHDGVGWGNRARDAGGWLDAVNTFSTNPDHWHPTRRHDVGRVHGVGLVALIDGDTIRIEPRHPYIKVGDFPAYTAPIGQVHLGELTQWLMSQHHLAQTERTQLREQQPVRSTSSFHNATPRRPSFER